MTDAERIKLKHSASLADPRYLAIFLHRAAGAEENVGQLETSCGSEWDGDHWEWAPEHEMAFSMTWRGW